MAKQFMEEDKPKLLLPGHLDFLSRFDNLPGHFYMYQIKKDQRILFCNQAQLDVTQNASLQDLIGQSIWSSAFALDAFSADLISTNNHNIIQLNTSCELIEEGSFSGQHDFYLSEKSPIYSKHDDSIIGYYGYSVKISHFDNPMDALAQKDDLLKDKPDLPTDLLYL